MNVIYGTPHYLDASAGVKLVIDNERGHKALKDYVSEKYDFYMTTFCFYETLSALKLKWKRKEIEKEQYFKYCHKFLAKFRSKQIRNSVPLTFNYLLTN